MAEHRIVVPRVAGSNPVCRPNSSILQIIPLFSLPPAIHYLFPVILLFFHGSSDKMQ